MNSKEMLHKAYQLSVENPELDVKIMVDNEFSDEYGSTEHEMKRVEIGEYGKYQNRIYCDIDDLVDTIFCNIEEGTNEKEYAIANKMADEIMTKVIIIRTCAT
jgi:hypothetical protein